jgi:dUTPase
MQLTGNESVAIGIIGAANTGNTHLASYDLSADRVIINGETKNLPFSLQPQDMCVVISKEHVKIPPDFVGYALPKTSLCQRGLLTLNTGILDPNYDGLISTTAINFRKESIEILPGDAFLRIVLHQLKPFPSAAGSVANIQNLSDKQYIERRESESAQYPTTFLDIPSSLETVANRIHNRAFQNLGLALALWIAILGLAFTLCNVIYTNFSANSAVKDVRDITASTGRVSGLEGRVDDITNSMHVGDARIGELERNFSRLDLVTKHVEANDTKIGELERNLTQLDLITKDLENRVQTTGRQR